MNRPKSLLIGSLTADDIPEVNRIFAEAITGAFAREDLGHLQEEIGQEVRHKQELAAASLQPGGSDTEFLVARVHGRAAGTVSFGPCGEEIRICTAHELDEIGELGSLYVQPDLQGQGIGSALIEAMLSALAARGIASFCLDSGYRSAQQRWCRKFGQPYKVVEDYWGPGSPHMVWLCQVNEHLK